MRAAVGAGGHTQRTAVGICMLLLGTWAAPAQAQGVDEFGAFGPHQATESDQFWAFELRFGPYRPDVDSDFSQLPEAERPYSASFGDATRFLIGTELDLQLLRIPYVGTLGPGFGIGYTHAKHPAPLEDGTGDSGQDNLIWIVPMYGVAVLRADVFQRQFGVPLVPYVKLGFGFALWQTGDGDSVAMYEGLEGKDISYGFQFAAGGKFLLDVLDPALAKQRDALTGVNHAYVFLELYSSQLGVGDQMHVGTTTWMTGLTFEI